ncbi:MAG: N-acetylmuramoyl-L-alanine amidase [Bryobacteraceae bacterium]|nr:N-acetylmuramoyl-L-alanine amidase [Bryobacteraceae bacterium]
MRISYAFLLACAATSLLDARTQSRELAWDPSQPARVTAPIAFRAVAAGQPFRARASADAVSWTPWLETAGDDALLFFDSPQRFLEIDAPTPLRLLFIDPGVSRAAKGVKLAASSPAIVPRSAWGCTPEACPLREQPVRTTVTHLVVHHTAGANSSADWAAVVRSIWQLHTQGNGWNDIGYNFLIDPNGVAYEGRGDGILGAHFSAVNTGTMGVALMGTFSNTPPTPAALATLTQLLAWQAERWRLDAASMSVHAASGLMLNTISGHRDAGLSPRASGTTECPGNTVHALLERLRREVPPLVEDPCPITVSETNRCSPAAGESFEIRFLRCSRSVLSRVPWIQTVSADDRVLVNVAPNDGARRSGSIFIGARDFPVTQSAAGEGPLPCIRQGGIISAAGDPRHVVPGSLISLYGSFPDSPTLTVNGQNAPVIFAGANQINAQLPPGIRTGTARAVVSAGGVSGPEQNFWVTEAIPSLFVYDNDRAIAANFDDGRLNGPAAPVPAGKVLIAYLTGGGAVEGTFPAAGTPTPNQILRVRAPWSATIGGRPAGAIFLGLTPGFLGLYQANLIVPEDLEAGDHQLILTVAGVPSLPALVTVAPR